MRARSGITGWTTIALVISVTGVYTLGFLPVKPAAAQAPGSEPVIYLDQGWSQADRETYYQISQGSVVMSYDIFMNLEAAGGQELFRSAGNSDRYGLITQPAKLTGTHRAASNGSYPLAGASGRSSISASFP